MKWAGGHFSTASLLKAVSFTRVHIALALCFHLGGEGGLVSVREASSLVRFTQMSFDPQAVLHRCGILSEPSSPRVLLGSLNTL